MQLFAMKEKDAQALEDVVDGIIPISNISSRCLLDSDSTHSFFALHFAHK